MEGWISDKLENLFETGSGTTPQSTNSNYYDGNINWLLTGDLNDGIITSTSKKITSKALSDYSTLKLYPKNSVVIALYGATIGKLGFLDIESTTNQACCVLFNSKRMEQKYLFYNLLFAKNRILALAVGGGQPNISQNIVKNFEISFPELQPEQQKIATILSTIDQTIAQTEQLIAKYKNIKQGLMHDLLTYGIDENGTIRNPQTHTFVEKKGLVVPEEWEVDSLGSCFDNFKSGNSITSENIFNIAHYPVYGGNGLRGYTNTYTHSGKYVLIGRQGALCGNINLVTGENYISEHAIAVLTNANNNIYYWYYKLDHMNLNQYSAQSAQPGLAVEKLIKLIVCIPQRHEQEKISQILNKQDSLIESEQTNLAKLQNLKQGLMADLLTGKVRVKI